MLPKYRVMMTVYSKFRFWQMWMGWAVGLHTNMDQPLIWISLCFGFGCSTFPRYEYTYVDMRVDFASAQIYCKEYYKDVATITSSRDMSMMIRPSTNQDGIWIGLNDDPDDWMGVMGNNTDSWRWSLTGQTSKTSYCNWRPSQPDFTVTNATGKFFVLVQLNLTWTAAQTFCRQNHTDLATIENADDSNVIQTLMETLGTNAYIGLYRIPWFWSDHNTSTFRNFAPGKPNNDQTVNFCVAELPDHTWTDVPCSLSLAFFCYAESRLRTILRIRSQTNADMTDRAINAQILQQIGAALEDQGGTVFEIKWNIQPKKR
ncbi:uncharacterized protein LOC114843251 isoform X2 [Betta splendens]|uniref:Uncharacterized protein LOC114843251 isoform X2 n=1 Tax=Betta splendens TaxID=158456 RepID=A0A9W2XCJ5_BETSP|nr:uncharacterized protein LOC114843251 isoform X2 [Betta splendens]